MSGLKDGDEDACSYEPLGRSAFLYRGLSRIQEREEQGVRTLAASM